MVRACAVVLMLLAVEGCDSSGTRPAETLPAHDSDTRAAATSRELEAPSSCEEAMDAIVRAVWDRKDCSHAENVFTNSAAACLSWKSPSTDTQWRDLTFELAHCHETTGGIESATRWYRAILAIPNWQAHRAVLSASGEDDGWAHVIAAARLEALQRPSRPATCIASRDALVAELRKRLVRRRLSTLRQLVARDFVWCNQGCRDGFLNQGLEWLQQELPNEPLTFRAGQDPGCLVTEGWLDGSAVAFLLTEVDGCHVWGGVQVPAQCEDVE